MDGIERPNILGFDQVLGFAQNLRNAFDQLPVRAIFGLQPAQDRGSRLSPTSEAYHGYGFTAFGQHDVFARFDGFIALEKL